MTVKKKYSVDDPTVFDDFVREHDLKAGYFMRLSPSAINALTDSIGCWTSGGIGTMFSQKYGGISGDCYAALSATRDGEDVLIFDCVRTDKTKDPQQYVMDQDPVFFKKENGVWGPSACKLSHADWNGRTLDYSAYNTMTSAYLPDTLYSTSDLEKNAKAIYDSFPYSCKYLDFLE